MKKKLKRVGSNLFEGLLQYNNRRHLVLSAFLLLLSTSLSSCSSVSKVKYEDAPRYGKLRFSRTTQAKNFSLITTEEFSKNDKSKKDLTQKGLTLKEVSLVTNLLKQQDYCIQKDIETGEILDEEPYFLITRKQPAAYQVLPEINYQQASEGIGVNGNKVMVVPATFHGQCISKENYFKIKEKREEQFKAWKKQKKEEKKNNKKKSKKSKNSKDGGGDNKNDAELSKEQLKLMKLQEKNRKKALKNSEKKRKLTRKKFESQMKEYKKIMKKEGKSNSKDANILLLF